MNLKIGKVLTSKSVGTGSSSFEKKNLPGRGLIRVGKHWPSLFFKRVHQGGLQCGHVTYTDSLTTCVYSGHVTCTDSLTSACILVTWLVPTVWQEPVCRRVSVFAVKRFSSSAIFASGHMYPLGCHWTFIHEIWFWCLLLTNIFWHDWERTKIQDTFREDPDTFCCFIVVQEHALFLYC